MQFKSDWAFAFPAVMNTTCRRHHDVTLRTDEMPANGHVVSSFRLGWGRGGGMYECAIDVGSSFVGTMECFVDICVCISLSLHSSSISLLLHRFHSERFLFRIPAPVGSIVTVHGVLLSLKINNSKHFLILSSWYIESLEPPLAPLPALRVGVRDSCDISYGLRRASSPALAVPRLYPQRRATPRHASHLLTTLFGDM